MGDRWSSDGFGTDIGNREIDQNDFSEMSTVMNRRWWMMLLFAVWASAAATGCQQARSERPPSVPVATYDSPITRTVTDYEEFPGQTDAIISVQIRARVSGYMTKVYFKDGDLVEEGNLLFEIDPRQYKAEFERADGAAHELGQLHLLWGGGELGLAKVHGAVAL